MARLQHTPPHASLEEAITVLFCLVDDAYRLLNPKWRSHEPLKRLSDSEVITLALLQQLRGIESCRSFLRDTQRFFPHLFPGVVGLHPSSLHRRIRKLGCFLEPLRRDGLDELVGDPETLIVDSTLLSVLHPRQVGQSAGLEGAAWARWGSFAVYGVKLHLLCATNRVPVSYELTPASTPEVLLTEELLDGSGLGDGVARRLLGDLAYRSSGLGEELADRGVLLATERADQRPSVRQHIEICFAALKGTFGLDRTLATTLVGLATRIAAKMTAHAYGCRVNRLLGRPQGRIKELWA
ncbi:MAG: Mobile element protein [uncultured Rubrobacteraceae bacterium]|uniref:Mobile element protein n=1 Tax=uncultured Rubrobacteraceae bacterium TaxID=349277 RepID=A0A6J4QUV0_9ACTN|nr:MAG: Mobile element protein [uncultured Rubrobacteraceae bacterium]